MVTTRGGGRPRSWVKVRASSQDQAWRTPEADGQAPTDPPYVGNQTSLPGTRLIAASPKGDGELALGLDPPVAVRTLGQAPFPEPRLDAAQTGAPRTVPLPQHADPGWTSGVGGLAQRAARALGPSLAVACPVPVIWSRVPTPATRVHTHARTLTHTHTHTTEIKKTRAG